MGKNITTKNTKDICIMKIYFTDFFNVSPATLEKYGAFNISLINDLPLFIDPFLLFGNKKKEYQELHKSILKYLSFLKSKSEVGITELSQIKSWYLFPEIKQNWFGYSKIGNSGSGLGVKFGKAMSSSMHIVFDDLGKEQITQSSHLEKTGLFEIGVGKDNISDFTTNLTKDFLLSYTERFAIKNIASELLQKVKVEKVYFDYKLERWMPKEFTLPFIFNDFVVLTPRDILTKDDNWINSNDLRGNFNRICNSIPNDQLRNEIFNYFGKSLPKPPRKKKNTQKEITNAIQETIRQFPEIIKWYIKQKEENKEGAKNISELKVLEVETIFIHQITSFVETLLKETQFYNIQPESSFEESLKRVHYLKNVIENNDGYRLFYIDKKPIKREDDLQIIYRLTWFASDFEVNREPNNGRGPVDYII
jgi:ASC-1-like (ASCH) protein